MGRSDPGHLPAEASRGSPAGYLLFPHYHLSSSSHAGAEPSVCVLERR